MDDGDDDNDDDDDDDNDDDDDDDDDDDNTTCFTYISRMFKPQWIFKKHFLTYQDNRDLAIRIHICVSACPQQVCYSTLYGVLMDPYSCSS